MMTILVGVACVAGGVVYAYVDVYGDVDGAGVDGVDIAVGCCCGVAVGIVVVVVVVVAVVVCLC